MKKKLVYEDGQKHDPDPDGLNLTRDDLEDAEIEIYNAILLRLNNPSPEQLKMLCAYSYAAAELRKVVIDDDKDLATHLRRCMMLGRNGLGPWNPVHISFMELLLDHGLPGHGDWPPVNLFLKREWQFGEDK
jgi:hypothetical protein